MTEQEKIRCEEFARLVFGKLAKSDEVKARIADCDSFNEFRVAIVLALESKVPLAARIASRWRERINAKPTMGDVNDLMHTIELMSLKQAALEKKLQTNSAELLDRMKAVDALATLQSEMREQLGEINDLVGEFRKHVLLMEERGEDLQNAEAVKP